MQLEDYFTFLDPHDIRLKGSRIGIETVLYQHLHRSQSPEEIVWIFPSLSLEQVYATILYYLHNEKEVRQYLEDWFEYRRRAEKEYEQNLPPVVQRLRTIQQAREKQKREAQVSGDSELEPLDLEVALTPS